MRSAWFSRLFFAVVAMLAVAGLMSGAACTRWGKPGPIIPTVAPLSQIYVDPHTGNDTTGNGSSAKPYKTFTKAVEVLASAKSFAPSGVAINLASGTYDTANGEKFPIVVPTNVTITGSSYGTGPNNGTFVDGAGEDTLFEHLVHAPARSQYTALEIGMTANVSLSDVYVGAVKLPLPPRAAYASLDTLGTLNASSSSFGAGIVSLKSAVSGILVAGGSLTCGSCQVQGNDFGIGALSLPVATASPSSTTPSITLSRTNGDSTIAAKVVDILTDGSTNVTASSETFEQGQYAFEDSLKPVVYVPIRGAVDFGGGVANSSGGNIFIGAHVTEISIVRRYETITAFDDTWNPNQQHANRSGQYTKKHTFGPGTVGKNVMVSRKATGSTVLVGPAPVTTPTPSSSPSPTASPT